MLVDDRWRFADPDRDAGTLIDADIASWCKSVSANVTRTKTQAGERRALARALDGSGVGCARRHRRVVCRAS